MVWLRWRWRRFLLRFLLQSLFLAIFLTLIEHSISLNNIENRPVLSSRIRASSIVSTCSRKADRRGPHQRVVSYSIYGNFSDPEVADRYLKPLRHIINQIPIIYPGWIVRIYHNSTIHSDELIRILRANGDNVDLCNATEIIEDLQMDQNIFAKVWRWLPILDDLVDVMISRDADSPLSHRESAAVKEWLESDYTFHIMRDHPFHCDPVILAGLWGVKLNKENSWHIKKVIEELFRSDHEHFHDFDQKILERFVWPLAVNDVMVHDSYCCEQFNGTRPFPTQRDEDGRFVGMIGQPGGPFNYLTEIVGECPEKCRKFHQWIYC